MTRARVIGAGLRGPGQLVFPEQAKDLGRTMGLTDEAVILDRVGTDDGGGAREYSWLPRPSPVPARVDAIFGGTPQLSGGIQDESSTHIITFAGDEPVSTDNRIEINEVTWAITAERQTTDQMVTRVEAREVPSS